MNSWGWLRRHWLEVLLPPAVFLLAAGITRQALRTWRGSQTASWESHYQAAIDAGSSGDREQALRHLAAAERAVPRNAEAHARLALGFEKLGERARAMRHMERALDLRPRTGETRDGYLGLVRSHFEQGRLGECARLLRETVMPRWPNSAPGHYFQGLLALRQEKGDAGLQRARKSLETCLALDPKQMEARYEYGVCLARLGRQAEAAARFREVLKVDPLHDPSYHELAAALRQQGEMAESVRALAKFQELDRKRRRVRWIEAQVTLGRPPPPVRELLELGQLYLDLQQFDHAAAALFRYVRKEPLDARGHRKLAEAYRRLDRSEEARAERMLARRLDGSLALPKVERKGGS